MTPFLLFAYLVAIGCGLFVSGLLFIVYLALMGSLIAAAPKPEPLPNVTE